jgi:uncharacterized membrane-anchored protein YjiN (DUF445 family)
LFHEIPIPFVRKHTNIIAKNRKTTEGIVDLVTNKWLSPNVIAEKLDEVDLAKIRLIQQPKHQQHGIRLIQIVLNSQTIRQSNIANTLQKYLKNRSPR